MNIVILDDYQDAVRKLNCAAKLEAYPAKVYTNTVKGIGQLSVRLRDADVIAAAVADGRSSAAGSGLFAAPAPNDDASPDSDAAWTTRAAALLGMGSFPSAKTLGTLDTLHSRVSGSSDGRIARCERSSCDDVRCDGCPFADETCCFSADIAHTTCDTAH